MSTADYTNNAPIWQVVSLSLDGKIEQILLPETETEAYNAYALVKETFDRYSKHFLIYNGFIIRQVTSS